MTVQQMFVAFSCLLLATQQIAAVVNNAKSVNLEETSNIKNVSSTSTKVADAATAATEQEAKRREAPILAISDSYGLPLGGGGDSYVPTGPSNPALPHPVYGVPDAPSNNIIYPAPPPDIPPPLPPVSSSYGLPLQTYGVPQTHSHSFGSHSFGTHNFGSSHLNFVPPPPPKYLPPNKPHKHFGGPSFHGKPARPRPQYGAPHKPLFVPKLHKPKPLYGPPPKAPLFVPQKNTFQQQQVAIVTIPSTEYGVPNLGGHPPEPLGPSPPIPHYGPPEPIPHGPPHPGVPAPPTPPDIKYDGWQPIPGLVSRPPSDSYGVPDGQHHGSADLHDNADFTPPPVGNSHISTSSHSVNVGYSSHSQGVRDSYGAPLNAVTGSGAIDSSSGDAHHDDQSLSLGLSAAGINGQSHLSVIKSIGYELFPNSGALSNVGDTYSSPPLSSYSPDGPYPASQSIKTSGSASSSLFGSSIKSHSSHGHSLSTSTIGLVPPSGLYGVPPNAQYGTPFLSKPSSQYGAPLNALKINPPKHPVIFREPVPAGLIESIGHHTAHKDAHGIIESSHSSGSSYIPPPIPDVTKPVREEEPPLPSNLYSLPNPSSSIAFQDVGHFASLPALGSLDFSSDHYIGGQALTSYTAPLGSIDGSYSLPLQGAPSYSIGLDHAHGGALAVGIDNSLPPVSIDLTSSTANVGSSIAHLSQIYPYQGGHDCKSHGSQPLPSLTYGVPSASSYTAALSSLTTNIGGAYQGPIPSGSYGVPDLHTEHSKKVSTVVPANLVEPSHGKSYGKSLAQNFGPDTELIASESIDVNNIPLQGSLGSYTLQIQSADGLPGSKANSEIQHSQVLNGGLLESILAAIEQPERKETNILGRPLSHLKPDTEGQHTVTNPVVVAPPATEATSTTTPESETAPLQLIDNNEIALYFKEEGSNKNSTQSDVRNGQQYGSYVSFKTPNASFAYGMDSEKEQKTGED